MIDSYATPLALDVPEPLENLLRRYARRSRRFRATWQAMTENGIEEETAQVAQALLTALAYKTVALISAEEGSVCPFGYVCAIFELNAPIADALANALVKNELATIEKREANVWGSHDGSYWSIGEAGVP